MTAGEPLADTLPPGQATASGAPFADDDTEGCTCLVAGYARKDGLIARVTGEADRRIMMSPALGDFLHLRYVDLGPQPDPADDRSGAVRRIVADLMTVPETAGRSHFALIIIAKSATVIEELLANCAADPFLARLRMRLAGIASIDDRQPGNSVADIMSSPDGAWRTQANLVSAVGQHCDELPRYFAARSEPGLTRAELATLRRDHVPPVADTEGQADDTDGAPGEAAVPDLLDGAPEASGSAPDQDAPPADSAGAVPAESAAGRLPIIGAFRRRPGVPVPWRPGKGEAAGADDPQAASPPGPERTAMGLIYLLMVVDQDATTDPALGRLQAALLKLDRRLAAESSCEYQVRVIHGRDDHLRGDLQDAGRLGRRESKRMIKTADFLTVLKVIRGSLSRDRGLVQTIATAAGLTVIPPTVVIFTADPPLAELGAGEVFADLAAEAEVVWVLPRKLDGLVSPAFGPESGATVLEESQAVADDILAAMPTDALTS